MTDQVQEPALNTLPPLAATSTETSAGTRQEPRTEVAKPESIKDRPTLSYAETGNRALDVSLRILGRAGVSPDSFEMQSARRGDFKPLRAVLTHMGAEDGDFAVDLMEQAYQDFQSKESMEKQNLHKEFHTIAGGEQEWNDTLKWIDANATDEESSELVDALEAGGHAARMAAKYMALMFHTFGGQEQSQEQPQEQQTEEQPVGRASARATQKASGAASFKGISANEYATKVTELTNQGVKDSDPRIQALHRQRLAAIRAAAPR